MVGTDGTTNVTLERVGEFPMPLDITVTLTDGSQETYYVPMNEMLGNKPADNNGVPRTDLAVWAWTNPTYKFTVQNALSEIATIEIDPSQRMADISRANNVWNVAEKAKELKEGDR